MSDERRAVGPDDDEGQRHRQPGEAPWLVDDVEPSSTDAARAAGPAGTADAVHDPAHGADVHDGVGTASPLHGRLHPSVIALWSLRAVVPLGALLLAGTVEQVLALGLMGLSALGSAVRWLRFEWRVEDDDLVIEQGLLTRQRRVIPRERIQAVQTVRKIRHRVFGVVGLRIEAVGGSDTEGQLDALPPGVATRVQHVLMGQDDASTPAATDAADTGHGRYLFHSSPRMLLVAGLTGGRVGVAAALIAFAQQFAGERITRTVLSAPERFGLTVVVVLVILGVVAAFALSVAATAVTFWDFTVLRDGDRLVLRRGLLDERRDTVPVRRIQSVTIEQNILRRLFGLATVKMTVAGRAGDDGVTGTLLPIATAGQARALVADVLGLSVPDDTALRAMPSAARARRLVRAAGVVGVVTVVALAVTRSPVGLLGLATAAVAVPIALAAYAALGWYRDDEVVAARAGVLVRRTAVTPGLAAQSVTVRSTPFQRRRGLATLRLEIARTRGAGDPRLTDIAADDARRLQTDLATEVAAT